MSVINAATSVVTLTAIGAVWAWLAFRGIPEIVAGVQEVRENWDNDDYWSHPDDLDYWDNELHHLLLEDNDPLDAWSELEWEGN